MLDASRLIPSTIYSVNGIFLGSLIEMSLFSLALADKIGASKKELIMQKLQQAKDKEILILEKNQELESKVQERTLALQQSNATKDKLFSIISHDLRSQMDVENVQKEEIQIKNLIEEKIVLFVLIAKNKQVKLINEVQEEIKVFADTNHLRVILRNLIANAFKFTKENGTITVSATQESKDFITIAVKDTGVGMTAEQIGKLFITNMHFSTRGTNDEHGTGLGLLLCKDFVEKNGGKIWVESEKDKGSTFYFTLPQKLSGN